MCIQIEKLIKCEISYFVKDLCRALLFEDYSEEIIEYYNKRIINGRTRQSIIAEIAKKALIEPNRAHAISLLDSNFHKEILRYISLDDSARTWFFNKEKNIEIQEKNNQYALINELSKKYIELVYKNILIFYDTDSMKDQRGIGRVSRSLFRAMISNGAKIKTEKEQISNYKKIYFFPSIHFCSSPLPQPNIIIIHDVVPLIYPDKFHPNVVGEWAGKFYKIAREAKKIITISRSSADDISKFLNIDRGQISIINNGVDLLKKSGNNNIDIGLKNYFVFLGSHDGHKNISVVFDAMKLSEGSKINLVMIGENASLRAEIHQRGIADRVHFLGRLSDDEVADIIADSVGLVFPSLYEGFGLPPMEAAILNTPSICSRRPAMTEVLEGAAIFCDPAQPLEWCLAMNKLAQDSVLRRAIAERAKKIAESLTWEGAAREYIKLIEENI